jgi:hypothetical protein
MRRRNPADDRRRKGTACAAEGEGCADGGPTNLRWEKFGVIAEAAAIAAGY